MARNQLLVFEELLVVSSITSADSKTTDACMVHCVLVEERLRLGSVWLGRDGCLCECRVQLSMEVNGVLEGLSIEPLADVELISAQPLQLVCNVIDAGSQAEAGPGITMDCLLNCWFSLRRIF